MFTLRTIAILVSLLLAGHASAEEFNHSLGYAVFCQEHADLCEQTTPSVIIAEPITMAVIAGINDAVNSRIKYRADEPHWYRVHITSHAAMILMNDHWDISPEFGDCDDYAVTKLYDLVHLGFDRGALRLTIVMLKGVAHLVLIVDTSAGSYVMDQVDPKLKLVADRPDLRGVATEHFTAAGASLETVH